MARYYNITGPYSLVEQTDIDTDRVTLVFPECIGDVGSSEGYDDFLGHATDAVWLLWENYFPGGIPAGGVERNPASDESHEMKQRLCHAIEQVFGEVRP